MIPAVRLMRVLRNLLAGVALLTTHGCATAPDAVPWGERATLAPGWERIGRAARDAATHPGTWAPAALAAGLQIDNADERLSDWARRETPVFGGTQDAIDASDEGVDIARTGFMLVALTTPGGDNAGDWAVNKTKGLLVGELTVEATRFTYQGIKSWGLRDRPDASNDESFPSGHAGKSSAYATLGVVTTDTLPVDPRAELALDTAFVLVAAGTGWARVEGGKHYPSDVLAGYALGNFMGRFFSAAFLGTESSMTAGAAPGVVFLQWQGSF